MSRVNRRDSKRQGNETHKHEIMDVLHRNISTLPCKPSNIQPFSPPKLIPPPDLTAEDVLLTEAVLNLTRYASILQHCCSAKAQPPTSTFQEVVRQAAADKPHINDWLPVELHEDNKGWQGFLEGTDPPTLCDCIDWSKPGGCLISREIDDCCVKAGIKSNGGTFSQEIPDLDTIPNMWTRTLTFIESRVPPSLLVVPVNKVGWGFTHLAPNKDGTGFEETEMTWVDKPVSPKFTAAQNKVTGRLRDVILKMGTLLTSPLLSKALLPPGCYPREMTLHLMRSPSYSVNLGGDIPVKLPDPVQLSPAQFICWKVSPPRQPVVFTGRPEQYSLKTPHNLSKTIIQNEKCTVGSVDVIGITKKPITDHNVQRHMQNEVSNKLKEMSGATPHLYETTEESRARLHLALWEGMYSMAKDQALLHVAIPLNHSLQWDMIQEDPRYSELQVGDDCMLFRDWVSVCTQPERAHKCRLEAHINSADSPIATLIPWVRAQNDKIEWITAVSNCPLVPLVLREKKAMYSMKSLLHCVQTSRIVDTSNRLSVIDAYIDGNQIGLCYKTAEGGKFVIFKR